MTDQERNKIQVVDAEEENRRCLKQPAVFVNRFFINVYSNGIARLNFIEHCNEDSSDCRGSFMMSHEDLLALRDAISLLTNEAKQKKMIM